MESRGAARTLSQLLELTSPNIIHLQPLSDLSGHIEAVCTFGIHVNLLQNQEVSFDIRQKLDHTAQPQSPIDVPVNDPYGVGRPKGPCPRRKATGFDRLLGGYIHRASCTGAAIAAATTRPEYKRSLGRTDPCLRGTDRVCCWRCRGCSECTIRVKGYQPDHIHAYRRQDKGHLGYVKHSKGQ